MKHTRQVATKSADFTVSDLESGHIFIVDVADVVATLPPVETGLQFTFVVKTPSTGTGFSVSPQAADAIKGNGLTGVDDKDLINSGVSDAEGDSVHLVSDGVDWWIASIVGTWAKEA